MSHMRLLLLSAALLAALGTSRPQSKNEHKPATKAANIASGKGIFQKYCASCHGKEGKGDGPAAFALMTAPADLTTLSKRYEGKFPEGYISTVLIFGKSFASHGSEDMPVWGSRFKKIDPVHDPSGQQHIDDVIAYIRSLQAK